MASCPFRRISASASRFCLLREREPPVFGLNIAAIFPIVCTFFFVLHHFLPERGDVASASSTTESVPPDSSECFACKLSQGPGNDGLFFGGLFAGHWTWLPPIVIFLGGSLTNGSR